MWRFKLLWREWQDRLAWRITYLLPRRVALFAFIRVYSVVGEASEEYGRVYDAWMAGKGR